MSACLRDSVCCGGARQNQPPPQNTRTRRFNFFAIYVVYPPINKKGNPMLPRGLPALLRRQSARTPQVALTLPAPSSLMAEPGSCTVYRGTSIRRTTPLLPPPSFLRQTSLHAQISPVILSTPEYLVYHVVHVRFLLVESCMHTDSMNLIKVEKRLFNRRCRRRGCPSVHSTPGLLLRSVSIRWWN